MFYTLTRPLVATAAALLICVACGTASARGLLAETPASISMCKTLVPKDGMAFTGGDLVKYCGSSLDAVKNYCSLNVLCVGWTLDTSTGCYSLKSAKALDSPLGGQKFGKSWASANIWSGSQGQSSGFGGSGGSSSSGFGGSGGSWQSGVQMCLTLKAQPGKGSVIDNVLQNGKVCGGLDKVAEACAQRGRCVGFTFNKQDGCGMLNSDMTKLSGMTSSWVAYTR